MLWIHGLLPFIWPLKNLVLKLAIVRGPVAFWRDYFRFLREPLDPRFPLSILDSQPCFYDRYDTAGVKPRHYFHQDLWAAQKVFDSKVKEHLDLGSRIDGFVAHCAVFCKVNVIDIRPLTDLNERIHFVQGDITNLVGFANESVHSLSSLHVFEHIGLGRYNDPIGPQYLRQAVEEVIRVLAPGASFYFAVPIGIQRLEFNGQRVFAPSTVLEMFERLEIVEFSAIDDADDLHLNANPQAFNAAEYSCGLFHFRKKGAVT
ncbi:MAG: DUF268 domain-containing protein [Bdellovibrionales bacterium]